MIPPIDELHPLFVHFPIALYSTAFLWELLGFWRRNNALLSAGWWNMILAQISAAATIVTGFIADSMVGHMEKPFPIYSTHGSLQLVCVFWLSGLFLYRWKKIKIGKDAHSFPWVYLILFGIGVLFMFYGSHLGAKLADRI